jgi:hypothetical protein
MLECFVHWLRLNYVWWIDFFCGFICVLDLQVAWCPNLSKANHFIEWPAWICLQSILKLFSNKTFWKIFYSLSTLNSVSYEMSIYFQNRSLSKKIEMKITLRGHSFYLANSFYKSIFIIISPIFKNNRDRQDTCFLVLFLSLGIIGWLLKFLFCECVISLTKKKTHLAMINFWMKTTNIKIWSINFHQMSW